MGDRIVVMCDGVIQPLDQPLTIYKHPDNVFVAEYRQPRHELHEGNHPP
jgi:multiple sugar transport system ATP-binding protein